MYRTRLTSDSYQSVRATLTAGYHQVQIEGMSDSIAVGFVCEYGTGTGPLPAGYMVFQGKQSKAKPAIITALRTLPKLNNSYTKHCALRSG